ncbi:MAG: ectoine/hydroxyectoine ABC transporter permease subunit EhuC, partial [Acidobacteria bacterium]|nr:ectoine/hydroxyectoine ABC transporter permease subunit EhuC [Acidobacteriota bacterium]
FGRWASLVHILLPQALLQIWPPMTNLLIELLKGTALVSLITLPDLTFQAQALRSATLKTPLIFAWVLILYFVAAQVIARLSHFAERRVGRWSRRGLQT